MNYSKPFWGTQHDLVYEVSTEGGIFERSVAFSDRATIRYNTIQYDTIQKVVLGKISLLKRIVNFLRNP